MTHTEDNLLDNDQDFYNTKFPAADVGMSENEAHLLKTSHLYRKMYNDMFPEANYASCALCTTMEVKESMFRIKGNDNLTYFLCEGDKPTACFVCKSLFPKSTLVNIENIYYCSPHTP